MPDYSVCVAGDQYEQNGVKKYHWLQVGTAWVDKTYINVKLELPLVVGKETKIRLYPMSGPASSEPA